MEKTEQPQFNEGSLRSEKKDTAIRVIIALPMILTMAILPLIMRLKIVEVPEKYQSYITFPLLYDHYSYYKTILLFFVTVWMLVIVGYIVKKKGLRFLIPTEKNTRRIIGGILFFLLLTVISTAVSPYRDYAIIGSYFRREGLIVYACYIMLVLYPILLMSKDEKYSCIIRFSFALITLCFLVLVISELFWKNPLVKTWINIWTSGNETIPGIGRAVRVSPSIPISLTMNNPNFVGSFCAMAFPIFFVQIFNTDAKILNRLSAEFLALMALFILALSRSQAGMVGVGVSIMVALFFLAKKFFSDRKKMISTAMILIIFMIGVNVISGGMLFREVAGIFQEGIHAISTDDEYVRDPTYGQPITDVIVAGKMARVVTTKGDFFIDFNKQTIEARSSDQKEIVPLQEKITQISSIHPDVKLEYKIYEDKRFVNIRYGDENFIRFAVYQKGEDDIYLGIRDEGYRLDHVIAPHWGFEGKEKIGSGRGYIWSRSIPLLKDTLLLGHGPDTFLIVFPQGDYLAKAYIGNAHILVDKPHNVYLQWMINHGVVATIGLLFALGVYILSTARTLVRKKRYFDLEYREIAILSAVCGYLAAGFFNDSIVSVAPLFWSLLGFGVSINRMQAEKKAKTEY